MTTIKDELPKATLDRNYQPEIMRTLRVGDHVTTTHYAGEAGIVQKISDDGHVQIIVDGKGYPEDYKMWIAPGRAVLTELLTPSLVDCSVEEAREDFRRRISSLDLGKMNVGTISADRLAPAVQPNHDWLGVKDIKVDESKPYEFVNAPKHYNDHPSGVECQEIIRECKDPMISFAMKHLWRSQWGGKPGQTTDQDLAKAIEYIQLEQARRAGQKRL